MHIITYINAFLFADTISWNFVDKELIVFFSVNINIPEKKRIDKSPAGRASLRNSADVMRIRVD